MRRTTLVGATLVVVVAAVLFLLLRDDSDDGKKEDTTGQVSSDDGGGSEEAALPLNFVLDDVPFTFQYPSNFAPVAAADLPQGYLAILGVSPINFVDVRLTANDEMSDADIQEIGTTFESDGVQVLGSSTRVVNGTTVFVFQVSDTSRGDLTISTLRFLRAGGKTWELGCQSDQTGSAEIAAACEGVLDTLTITG